MTKQKQDYIVDSTYPDTKYPYQPATPENTQTAFLNMLEDFNDEKQKMELLQQATMNLLEDFNEERLKFQAIQKATLNILEDMNAERNKLNETQQALLNILEDVEVEKNKAEQAKSQLEVSNKELESFSYSVSHDLRTPLRAISGFSAAVIEDYQSVMDDTGKRYLSLIAENADRMGELIDNLLSFSRLGRQEIVRTEIDLTSLIQVVLEELKGQTVNRNVEYIILTVPPVYGDRAMLQQVLVNLFSNAVKFTKNKEKAVIEFGCKTENSENIYYIKDNGAGFDMQYANKLFGVFQRLHKMSEYEGTGVGLALVYRIITRHGGRVWATGEVDKGSTFYFTLPAQ